MKDLFGNTIEEPADDYNSYMASPKWAKKREEKLSRVGHKCERCGVSKYSGPLDVHHLTYDRLGNEKMSDLEVLCKPCHEGADVERVITKKEKKSHGSLAQGFANWMVRGDHDMHMMSTGAVLFEKRKFLSMLYNKTGQSYSLDLNVLGITDDEPDWSP